VNFGHYCRIKVIFSIGMVLYFFNYSEPISVNSPSVLMEFLKNCFKKGHCDINAVSSNEAKLKNQIYNIRCLGSIIFHNLPNNLYLSF